MDNVKEALRVLIQDMVMALVRNEAAVVVTYEDTEDRTVYTVAVANDDAKLVIGRKGNNARSLRQITWSAGKKSEFVADLKIDVPELNSDTKNETEHES